MPKMCAIPGLASAPFIPKPVERRSVASCYQVALFLDDNKTNDDGNGKENGKKIKCLY